MTREGAVPREGVAPRRPRPAAPGAAPAWLEKVNQRQVESAWPGSGSGLGLGLGVGLVLG